ncbi:MAG: hypothetical protein Q4B42_03980 [Oscillospiraceae bacterium]|nr:hypothetical protein [Oscillospiraceae bacterium]
MKQWITSCEELAQAVLKMGFLPFFQNDIKGFSIEEHISPELWFSDTADGPWEWKGPVIRGAGCAYGKLFRGKAGFISAEWYPDFANYRRKGYDFDARYDDGLAGYQEKEVYDLLAGNGSLLSKELKRLGGFHKHGKKDFDAIITRLQMQGYVVTEDFEYQRDKHGNTYGWGVARYTTPERRFGEQFINTVYLNEPQQSKERMVKHLSALLPDADEKQILKLLG